MISPHFLQVPCLFLSQENIIVASHLGDFEIRTVTGARDEVILFVLYQDSQSQKSREPWIQIMLRSCKNVPHCALGSRNKRMKIER